MSRGGAARYWRCWGVGSRRVKGSTGGHEWRCEWCAIGHADQRGQNVDNYDLLAVNDGVVSTDRETFKFGLLGSARLTTY